MSAPGLRERFESSLRSGKRRIGRGVPASRRVKGLGGAKGRRRLQVRKLVAPFLQRPITLTTPTGLRLRVTGDPVDELIAQHLLGPNRSEYFPAWPGEARSGMCILDVGAHHGLYAAAALHEYPSSRVICVEPSPSSLPALHANLAVNGYAARARIVNAALAAAPGVGLLRHTDEGSWGNSLFEEEAVATSSEKVVLTTLADILQGDQPDVVKCNAEGAEFSLFAQLAELRLTPTLMIVMVHPEFGDLDALVGQAEAMGYTLAQVGTATRPAFHLWHDATLDAGAARS